MGAPPPPAAMPLHFPARTVVMHRNEHCVIVDPPKGGVKTNPVLLKHLLVPLSMLLDPDDPTLPMVWNDWVDAALGSAVLVAPSEFVYINVTQAQHGCLEPQWPDPRPEEPGNHTPDHDKAVIEAVRRHLQPYPHTHTRSHTRTHTRTHTHTHAVTHTHPIHEPPTRPPRRARRCGRASGP